MKKMLALLLALMLALSCTLALAETAETTAPAFNGLTIESEYDVNRAALTDLLTQMGLDESIVKIIDTVAAIIDESGEKVVIAKDGFQAEMLLKGASLVNLVGKISDTGITIGSNLVPNYVLNASFEEIGSMVLSSIQEQANVVGSLDMPAIQEALNNHINEFVETSLGAFIPGEVQTGEFEQDGVKYNTRIPMKVDMPTLVDATNTLLYNLQNDEAIQTALVQLALMGVNVNFDAAEDGYTIVDPAYLPAVNVEIYSNETDGQTAPTQMAVIVDVVPAGETTSATKVNTRIDGNNVTVDAQFISANTTVTYAMDRNPDDPFAVNARMDAYVNGFYVGFAAVTASNDQNITADAYVYVQDTEKAIAEEHGAITMEGALTLGVSDKATALTLSDLTGEDASDATSGLAMDLLLNGLGGVLSTANQAMPDEVGALMSLFQGDSASPAA